MVPTNWNIEKMNKVTIKHFISEINVIQYWKRLELEIEELNRVTIKDFEYVIFS